MKNSKLFKTLTSVILLASLFLCVAFEIFLKVPDRHLQFFLISTVGFFVVIPINNAVIDKIQK